MTAEHYNNNCIDNGLETDDTESYRRHPVEHKTLTNYSSKRREKDRHTKAHDLPDQT